jgi:hypothetical protein
MKAKHHSKPVRKCHDCGLNLGDHCGVYSAPRDMWHRRNCPGYRNEEMLARYEAEQAKHPPNPAKQLRREVAKRRASEPHWQGTLPVGTGSRPGR